MRRRLAAGLCRAAFAGRSTIQTLAEAEQDGKYRFGISTDTNGYSLNYWMEPQWYWPRFCAVAKYLGRMIRDATRDDDTRRGTTINAHVHVNP